MIRITLKSSVPVPATLTTKGVDATQAIIQDYKKGKRNFEFSPAIYAAPDVKAALRNAQHDKCCFCEAFLTHITDGDVEHFRPKKAVKQSKTGPMKKPGYYWLAYDWDNLFLACTKCNQRNKANLFPLSNPSKRASHHKASLVSEKPLFLHPFHDDPSMHIGFYDEVPKPINHSKRGAETIASLALHRPELNEDRARVLNDLKILFDTVTLVPLVPAHIRKKALQNLRQQLKEKTADHHPYAGMFRAFFANNPVPAT